MRRVGMSPGEIQAALLKALADPHDPKKSWSHFNVYDAQDRSQSFRFEKIRIAAYPTILVQPPRSKKYGEPSTVVFQGTYGGDPRKLATEITTAIRRYLARLSEAKSATDPAVWEPWIQIGDGTELQTFSALYDLWEDGVLSQPGVTKGPIELSAKGFVGRLRNHSHPVQQ